MSVRRTSITTTTTASTSRAGDRGRRDSAERGSRLRNADLALIVVGVRLALAGYNQPQAAQEWHDQRFADDVASCGEVPVGHCVRRPMSREPYKGGESMIGLGVILAIVGGIEARYGAQ